MMRHLASSNLAPDLSDLWTASHSHQQRHLSHQDRYLELRSSPPEQPSNDAVQTLTKALITLKASTQLLLPPNTPFPPALPTYPNFSHLSYPMISAAMFAAQIRLVGNARTPPVGAAAAANGLGLCNNYTELDVCEDEETHMPMTRLLAVEYTRAALVVTLSPFQASRNGFDWMQVREWGLGGALLPAEKEQRKRYWADVRSVTSRFVVEQAMPVTVVIVIGECALDEKFLEVMRGVLENVLPDGRDSVLSIDDGGSGLINPRFAASRGAAEFGKRILEGPDGCVEMNYCKWWRKIIG